MRCRTLVVALLVFVWCGCKAAPNPAGDPLNLGTKVATLKMKQRSAKTVPGVMGRISLKIGDVETANGVERVAVIDHKDEKKVLEKSRMHDSGTAAFEIDDVGYELMLVETDASHLLNDTATFSIKLDR